MKKKATYTAAIGRNGEWRIGWIEEAPGANRQESSGEELLDSLPGTSRETPEIKSAGSPGAGFGRELISIRSAGSF